jgi:hypothetical protein
MVWILLTRARKKDMSGEESMVLSHIQAAGNEGMPPRSQYKVFHDNTYLRYMDKAY